MSEQVIRTIRENLFEILPKLEDMNISNDLSFIEMGANSVDRGELITLTLERLELDISRIEFVNATTINELAELIVEKGD